MPTVKSCVFVFQDIYLIFSLRYLFVFWTSCWVLLHSVVCFSINIFFSLLQCPQHPFAWWVFFNWFKIISLNFMLLIFQFIYFIEFLIIIIMVLVAYGSYNILICVSATGFVFYDKVSFKLLEYLCFVFIPHIFLEILL